MAVAKEQVNAGLRTLLAVSEAIRSLGTVPSGHLYTQVMGHMSLDSYNGCIACLVRAELVEESNHVLTWIGPKMEDE